jgi:DNA-binding cell septation regulator SpoVG
MSAHFLSCFWKLINVPTQPFMKIKRVEIVPIRPFEGLIAFANVTLEEGLYLGSIGIHRKLDGGFRITFPTRKVGDTNLCIYHPINPMVSKEFEMVICSRAEEVFGKYLTT